MLSDYYGFIDVLEDLKHKISVKNEIKFNVFLPFTLECKIMLSNLILVLRVCSKDGAKMSIRTLL